MRVFLDANVLFSAAKSDGAVRALVRLLIERGHECCADGYVVSEAYRNVAAKVPAALEVLGTLVLQLNVVEEMTEVGAAAAVTQVGWLAEKDRPVLAAAIRLRCDVLVTGDRMHFGEKYGQTVGGVTILSPRMLAERVLA